MMLYNLFTNTKCPNVPFLRLTLYSLSLILGSHEPLSHFFTFSFVFGISISILFLTFRYFSRLLSLSVTLCFFFSFCYRKIYIYIQECKTFFATSNKVPFSLLVMVFSAQPVYVIWFSKQRCDAASTPPMRNTILDYEKERTHNCI